VGQVPWFSFGDLLDELDIMIQTCNYLFTWFCHYQIIN
jgi:hypothetical protein